MKRLIFAILILAAFSMLPSPGTELGELHPVSLLLIQNEGNSIRLTTDTEEVGQGETLDMAIRDLRETASGHLFLETVETLLIEEKAQYLLPELHQLLRPNVRVCRPEGAVNVEEAAAYLSTHLPERMLKDALPGKPIPVLYGKEGRYLLGN